MGNGYVVIRRCQFPIGTMLLGSPLSGLREAHLVDEDGDGKVKLLLKQDKPIVHPFELVAPFIMPLNLHRTQYHA